MDLTKKERVIIANQLKILEKLYPDEAKYYADHRKAIEYGFKLHYSWVAENIDANEMSEEECKEVLNILDMHRAITNSYNRIKEETELTIEDIRFRGFDGNNETRQFSYTNYFVNDLGRFDELRYGSEYSDFNSHRPTIDKYRRMLDIWNEFPEKFKLNEEQIKQLLEA